MENQHTFWFTVPLWIDAVVKGTITKEEVALLHQANNFIYNDKKYGKEDVKGIPLFYFLFIYYFY
jgi:hypothetical protein